MKHGSLGGMAAGKGGAAVLIVMLMVLSSTPALAATADAYVDVLDMVRTWNGASGLYEYKFRYFACNEDQWNNFDADVKWEFQIFNNGWDSIAPGVTESQFHLHLTPDTDEDLATECTNTVNAIKFNHTEKFCCGKATLIVLTDGADNDANNNVKNDNDPTLVILGGETRTVKAAVFNWGAGARTYLNSIDQNTVPSGWTAAIETGHTQVSIEGWEVHYFNVVITAPATITAYPSIVIESTTSDAGYDQETNIVTKGSGTSDCA